MPKKYKKSKSRPKRKNPDDLKVTGRFKVPGIDPIGYLNAIQHAKLSIKHLETIIKILERRQKTTLNYSIADLEIPEKLFWVERTLRTNKNLLEQADRGEK